MQSRMCCQETILNRGKSVAIWSSCVRFLKSVILETWSAVTLAVAMELGGTGVTFVSIGYVFKPEVETIESFGGANTFDVDGRPLALDAVATIWCGA